MAFMLPVSLNIPYSLLVMHLWDSNCVQCNASVVSTQTEDTDNLMSIQRRVSQVVHSLHVLVP